MRVKRWLNKSGEEQYADEMDPTSSFWECFDFERIWHVVGGGDAEGGMDVSSNPNCEAIWCTGSCIRCELLDVSSLVADSKLNIVKERPQAPVPPRIAPNASDGSREYHTVKTTS